MVYTRAWENKMLLSHTRTREKIRVDYTPRKNKYKKIRSHTNVRKIDLHFNLLKHMLEKIGNNKIWQFS